MQEKIVTSFFTSNGIPSLGLVPLIKIWCVDDSNNTLLIDNDQMTEIGDGFYRYTMSNYSPTKSYLFRTDGGPSLNSTDRYQDASNTSVSSDTAFLNWEQDPLDHTNSGTFGETVNQNKADLTQLRLDVVSMNELLVLLSKYEFNRTKIDKISKTLTVYDNDGNTVLRVFNLLDSTGTPSVSEVCERVPQ